MTMCLLFRMNLKIMKGLNDICYHIVCELLMPIYIIHHTYILIVECLKLHILTSA